MKTNIETQTTQVDSILSPEYLIKLFNQYQTKGTKYSLFLFDGILFVINEEAEDMIWFHPDKNDLYDVVSKVGNYLRGTKNFPIEELKMLVERK